jgi:hypothetical protein
MISDFAYPLFGGSFGSAANASERDIAWFNQAAATQNANAYASGEAVDLPAGIFWEQTGGRLHKVIIRREIERVYLPKAHNAQLGMV